MQGLEVENGIYPGMYPQHAYALPVWRFEGLCLDCGRHLFLPDGESCIYCGGDSLRDLDTQVLLLRMHAATGELLLPE